MPDRRPGAGRYARPEREQRWLLARLPGDVLDPVEIADLYVSGTTLRLRRMWTGSSVVYKLGQKVRDTRDSPARIALTNLYLREDEFDTLAGRLQGASLRKTRWHWPTGTSADGRALSVDVFLGDLHGLVTAEVELDENEPYLVALDRDVAVADVTDDDRFSGGSLAHLSPGACADLVAEVASMIRKR